MKHLQFILTLCLAVLLSSVLVPNAAEAQSCCVMRGDVDESGTVNVSDLTYLVNYLFKGGPAPACADHGDVDLSGNINVSDLTYIVNYLFKGGPAPADCPAGEPYVFIDEYGPGVTYEAFAGSFLEAVQVTAGSAYAGTQGLEITIPGDAPYWSGGAFTDSAECDLTAYNAVTFWAKASQAATLDVAGLGNDNTGTSKYMAEVSGLALTTDWQQFVIPFPLAEKLSAERGLFYFAEGEGVTYQIWVDEVVFDSLSTITNPRPAITTETIEVESGGVVNPSNGTVIFDVGGTDMTVSAMPGYFTFTSSDPSVVSVGLDGVITAVAPGTATLTADLGAVAASGSITVNVASPVPVPTTPAPTPTVSSDSVISLFSDAYTDHPVGAWSTDWDQADVEDYLIGSDNTKKYTNLNFAGILFESPTVDASTMSHFHMDVWTPDPTAAPAQFKIKLVDFGPNNTYDAGGVDDSEHELAFGETTMNSEEWVSIDVPLSAFTGLTGTANLAQMIISGDPNTVYVDNVYFYDAGLPTEPENPAPTPTVPSAYVVSLYSDAYTSHPVVSWSAGWDQADVEDYLIGSDNTKKYSNLNFAGIDFTSPTLDASAMTYFHMDVWTPDPTASPAVFNVKLVSFGADGAYQGGDDSEHELVFDETTMNTGSWVSIDVPLSAFTNLAETGHLAQMVISGDPNTVWVDNIYFYTPPPSEPTSSAPTPTDAPADVFSIFSNAYTSTPFDVWSSQWDNADVADFTIGSDDLKKYYNLVFSIAEYTSTGTQDISTYTHFHIDVWTPDATDGSSAFKIKLVDFGPNGIWDAAGDDTEHELTFDQATMSTGSWVSFDIPLADFTGLTTTEHFAQLILSGTYGTVFVDNIYFHK